MTEQLKKANEEYENAQKEYLELYHKEHNPHECWSKTFKRCPKLKELDERRMKKLKGLLEAIVDDYKKSPNAKRFIEQQEVYKLKIGEWFAVQPFDSVNEMQKVNTDIAMWQRPDDGKYYLYKIYPKSRLFTYGNINGYSERPDWAISKLLK